MRDRREAVLEAAEALVARPSENPPGEEAAVAEWLFDRLESSAVPFEVETTAIEPGRPNVVARIGDPDRGTVLLTGHTDVVPADSENWTTPPYKPEVRDGRLYGRGTADMKGALAAMIVGTERYVEQAEESGEVVLAFAVDEEYGGRGTQALVEGGLDADIAVVGEPTDLDVCTAIKGVSRYEVTITGEGCHSGMPDKGRDAIRALSALLDRIAALDDELEETAHEVLAHEDVTVTEVAGGLAPNVVAERASATIDWRFLPGKTTPEPFDRRFHEALDGITSNGDPVDVDVDRTVFARAAETDTDHQTVSTVLDAASSEGIDTELVGFNAATDARFLVHDAGIPTVHFGPGSITDDAHTVDESVAVADLVAAAGVYEAVLEEFF